MKDIDQSLLKKIEKLYGLQNIKFVKKIHSGYLSHNFVLRSGSEKYFLKQYKYKERERIEQIHFAQDFFSEGGIPVIHAIIAKNGKEIFTYKKKYFTLLPFVQGRIIKRKDRSKKAFYSAGVMLGKIHILSKNGSPKAINTRAHWTESEFKKESKNIYSKIVKIKRKTAFDRLALKTLNLKLNLIQSVRLSQKAFKGTHLIHGDFHSSNIFFNNKDEVSHVFDIEKAEAAPRAYEIARSLEYMCFSTEYTKKTFEDAKTYLRGYNSIYPISKKELIFGIKINYSIMVYSLWLLNEHYILKSTRTDRLLKSHYKDLVYYSEHFDEFVKKLLG